MSMEVYAVSKAAGRPFVSELVIGTDSLDLAYQTAGAASYQYTQERTAPPVPHTLPNSSLFAIINSAESPGVVGYTEEELIKLQARSSTANYLSCLLLECNVDPGGPYPAVIRTGAEYAYGEIMLGIGLISRQRQYRRNPGKAVDMMLEQVKHVAPMSSAEFSIRSGNPANYDAKARFIDLVF